MNRSERAEPSLSLPAPEDKADHVRSMFDRIAPRYDLVNRVMTFGLDTRWRRKATAALGLEPRTRVVDIACGTGDFCRDLDRAGIESIGVDLSLGMLKSARTSSPLAQADTFALPFADASVDGITCGFALRNFVEIPPAIGEFARITRSGGRVALLEVAEPRSRFVRAGHSFYFDRVVPRIGGMLSDKAAYRYLPESVAYLPAETELTAMLEDGGFGEVDHRMLFTGAAQLFVATRV